MTYLCLSVCACLCALTSSIPFVLPCSAPLLPYQRPGKALSPPSRFSLSLSLYLSLSVCLSLSLSLPRSRTRQFELYGHVHRKDAFLVLRSICKLALKDLPERDGASHDLRSKLLSLDVRLHVFRNA
jgi:hypothetical protein